MPRAHSCDDDALTRALEALLVVYRPDTVFFPDTLLPLLVDARGDPGGCEGLLRAERWLGVVWHDVARGGQVDVAGLGEVLSCTRIAPERWQLTLRGCGRIRVLPPAESDAVSGRFPRVRAALLQDVTEPPAQVHDAMRSLQHSYRALLETWPQARTTIGHLWDITGAPGVLADMLCAALLESPRERQAALADVSVVSRLHRARQAMEERLLQHARGDGEIH